MAEAPRLSRRPEARAFSVEYLLQLAQDGKLRIPEFQRPQRWRSTHVLSLFDSVARGFPIGPLLFSRQKAPRARVKFGPVNIDAPEVDGAMWVVDGQQRLTALVGALRHPDQRPRGDIHAIWYDLAQEKFERLAHGEPPPHWIPLNVVGDSSTLLRWLRAWPLSAERQDLEERAIELSKSLREYQAPAYIVEGADEAALRLIFKRVNTAGVPMREEEVFEALHGQQGKPVKAACDRLAGLGWGRLGEDDFLDALKAVADMDPRARFRDGERDLSLREDALGRTEIAIGRAIRFLSGGGGILHFSLLPYRLPLRILARFFDKHPNLTPRVESLLVRWVWRGALSGQHADNGDVVVDRLQKLIGADPSAAASGLLEATTREPALPSVAEVWNGRNAKTRLCALAMIHLGPRDPVSGEVLTRDTIQARLEHSELSGLFLKRAAASEGGARRRGLGQRPSRLNRAELQTGGVIADRFVVGGQSALKRLLDMPPDGEGPSPSVRAILDSHGLDREALAMLHAGDSEGFVRRRTERLDPRLHRFFCERAALAESDRPAIVDIVRRVEGKSK